MNSIVVFGNATVDLIFNLARWPSEGETILAESLVESAGGKGLNQAIAAARFGVPVRLLAPVGHDANAQFLREACARETGLSVDWNTRDHPTDISTIWISERGENVIVSSAHCARSVTPEDATERLEALSPGDTLLLQGNLTEATTRAAVRKGREKGAYVIVNTAPVWWVAEDVLAGSDLVICNEPEAAQLGAADARARHALQRKLGIDLIVTLGSRGAQGVFRDGDAHFPAAEVTAVDTSGAGDLTVGAIAASLQRGRTLPDSIRMAMQVSALCVTRQGTLSSFPSTAEIRALFDR